MLDIFERNERVKNEIKWLKIKYEVAEDISNLYCGWTFAYREAICSMFQKGFITEDQKNMFFDEASRYQKMWESHLK